MNRIGSLSEIGDVVILNRESKEGEYSSAIHGGYQLPQCSVKYDSYEPLFYSNGKFSFYSV